jgi:hypothetical protein
LDFNTDKIYTYSKGDELYTPSNAIIPLIKYIPKDKVIWECAEKQTEDGNITKELRNNGYKVITTSIHNGYDFLKCDIPKDINCIITNPPFSLKNEFLERCYKLNLPFALLLPIQALDTKRRFNYYKKYGLDLLIFDKRISYIGSHGSPPFASAWFTNKILPERLVFEHLP